MQGVPPPAAAGQYAAGGNAELWAALQQQQQAESAAAAMNGGMPALQGYVLPGAQQQQHVQQQLQQQQLQQQQQQQQQFKPLPAFGAGGGITGLPTSLTSLPGAHYGAAPLSLPGMLPQQHSPPQPYGAPQVVGGGAPQPGGFPQLSGLSSQLSSGMVLGGMPGGAPQMMPTLQPMQLSGSVLASAAHIPASSVMLHTGPGGGAGGFALPIPMPISTHPPGGIKLELEGPSSSRSAAAAVHLSIPDSPGSDGDDGEGSPADCMGSGGLNKSRFRGVSYDRKKAKWRVQIKVAALGKSGVSVGYFDTEEAAARAYDRAAIGLLGRDNPNLQTNFDARDYTGETIPPLTGKTREEVKTTLKSERIKQAPRRRFTSRQRTSRFMGVGSSNRKNQWQARILVHGKVTHLGYYETEEEAARVYDKVSLALHGDGAQTNFASSNYSPEEVQAYSGLDRENLQRALGVKPMDKSSRFRGVSKKKGKWEAKVMVNRRWAYRELFDSEEEAARAYDRALWRLKPKEAHSYVNFKDDVPAEVAHLLAAGGEGAGGELPAPASGGRAASARARGSRNHRALSSEEEEEEEEPSDGSDLFSDEDGSGGMPQAWTARGTSRSGRRLRGPAVPPAGPSSAPPVAMLQAQGGIAPRVASAPNLSAGPTQHSPPPMPMPMAQEQQAAAAQAQAGGGFIALAGGGLQLQFGGGAGAPAGLFGAPPPPPASAASPLQLPGDGGSGQPLMVRVGSETHLIPNQQPALHQQQQHQAGGGAGRGGPGSTLGKRMSRIQSEPAFHFKDDGAGELSDLMNDRDLFKAFDLNGLQEGGASGGGMGGHTLQHVGTTSGLDLDLDTSELLDFIKDMPDTAPVGGAAGGGRGSAGMFKSRSMGNLMDLSGPFFDEEDEALASMEFARPRKLPKSMSVGQLAGMGGSGGDGGGPSGAGGGSGRPPLPPGNADKLGPLGKPIRRTNTFSSSLAVLQEADPHAEGASVAGSGSGGLPSLGAASHHSSGEDLVQRLMAPQQQDEDDPMGDASLATDYLG
ncbi:AP2-like ethylene-responsive transcription factor TOE3 [Micractinium conductrix]|uniref:AP2-like ethylene-responsive transcription factor TOE3 n=1 Tax=Micractinium conductrix TaxID=554055 RepID=A0A2P6VSF4_9CHLO|nr:AP2-like ethylene-responsive transcription factor TOE3 [Micractinium conductrix]|eukprot:PSC77007.1 AP2-like ethylene-responsive transcription factor TOE3 [Micractinium conductrix]